MDRRKFVSSGLITLAAPPILGPTCALAKEQSQEPDAVRRERVKVFLSSGVGLVLLAGLFVIATNIVLTYNMNRMWWRHPLGRVALGGLAGLSRPTAQKRMGAAELIGTAVVINAVVYVILDVALNGPPEEFLIINQNNEFTTKTKPSPVKNADEVRDFAGRILQSEVVSSTSDGKAFFDVWTDFDGQFVGVTIPPHPNLRTPRS